MRDPKSAIISRDRVSKLAFLDIIELGVLDDMPRRQVDKYSVSPDEKPKMKFYYRGTKYDLTIKDPDFVNAYKKNPSSAPRDSETKIYLTISIGPWYEGKHYKFIEGVLVPPFG